MKLMQQDLCNEGILCCQDQLLVRHSSMDPKKAWI